MKYMGFISLGIDKTAPSIGDLVEQTSNWATAAMWIVLAY